MKKLDELDSLVNESKLPNQLKEYFTSSTRIKEMVTTETIKDIEDLYIFYNAVYIFDTSEFAAHTITSVKKCKDIKSFYYYLKKVIDVHLDLKSKDSRKFNEKIDFQTQAAKVLFSDTVAEFGALIDKIHKKDKDINLPEVYKSLGKVEMVNELIKNHYYKLVLSSGKKVLEKYAEETNN